MAAILLVTAGCSLESALGVDDDGGGSSSTTGPGGGSGQGDAEGPASGSTTTGQDGTGSSDSGVVPSDCGGRSLRVATFNIESVGSSGSASFEALRDVVTRIDADLLCLQEVEFFETADLFALANQAGYSDVIQANEPPAIGGDFTNACLSRFSLSIEGSYSGWDLSADDEANDVGRDILVVRADLAAEGEPSCAMGVVTLHLKSGQEQLDWFRRQIEAERVVQAIDLYRQAHPDEPMVILGDLNETIDDPALGAVFPDVPMGLPPSYQVGSDIVFPVTYQPFDTLAAQGFVVVDAFQEGSPARDETWNDVVRLDYVMRSDAQLVASEVYNACRDQGGGLPKAGQPLACSVSETASDHFPVFVDLTLP